MRQSITTVLIVALFLSLVGWLYFRSVVVVPLHNVGQSLKLPTSGRAGVGSTDDVVLDSTAIAEMENFAQEPRFRGLVKSYIANLSEYSNLEYSEINHPDDPASTASVLRSKFQAVFAVDDDSKSLYQNQSEAIDALSAHIAVLLHRCSGMSCDSYVTQSGTGLVFRIKDEDRPLIRAVLDKYLPGSSPEIVGDPEKCFRALYALSENFRNGTGKVVAYSISPRGLVGTLTMSKAPDIYNHPEKFDIALASQDYNFLQGKLAKTDLVLTVPVLSEICSDPLQPVLCSNICVIVKTKGNDMYPVHYQSFYDPKRRRWWLAGASRACSPRMSKSPNLVY